MAFPPNYNQERNNRARAKQRKALEKQERREEKSSHRKPVSEETGEPSPSIEPEKDKP